MFSAECCNIGQNRETGLMGHFTGGYVIQKLSHLPCLTMPYTPPSSKCSVCVNMFVHVCMCVCVCVCVCRMTKFDQGKVTKDCHGDINDAEIWQEELFT